MAAPSLAVIFNNVDADRSGRISADELQRALSNGTWTPFNPETCRLMIGMFDSDRDGAINFAEFSALWEYVNQWTQCFRSFDRDGSGNIDKDELSAALRQFGRCFGVRFLFLAALKYDSWGYRLSERFIDLLMIKFDRTHTHRVNFDDFIQLCVVLQTLTASFRDKDADRDGVITVGYEEFLTMVFICNI
uniref:Programmed cell death protein 6 n=1 Tax=Ascaris lumbricoides TaxID=6252 RepID=A0A0M3HPL7_ASCLU